MRCPQCTNNLCNVLCQLPNNGSKVKVEGYAYCHICNIMFSIKLTEVSK